MTIPIKTKQEIGLIKKAGRVVSDCLIALNNVIKPDMTTREIDFFVDWFLLEHGAIAAQKGYKGYKFASCISVNEVACHGIPTNEKLREGDIVTVDIVADVKGFKADSAWTYIVGRASPEVTHLIDSARRAMRAGIKCIKPGLDIAEIGSAIEVEANRLGYHVISQFAGHGIGRELHEAPQILNIAQRKSGIILCEGMVITVEPIVIAGPPDVYTSKQDGWSVISRYGSLSAQFEHTVLVTKDGHAVLTSQRRHKKS